jgi:hypothetical protein
LTTENVCSRIRVLLTPSSRRSGRWSSHHTLDQSWFRTLATHSPFPSDACLRYVSLSGSQCDVARSNFNKRRSHFRVNYRFADLQAATWMVRLLNRACTSFNYSVFKWAS